MNKKLGLMVSAAVLALTAQGAMAGCKDISRASLDAAVAAAEAAITGGYGLPMWATVVDETGMVCEVTTSGVAGASSGNNEWLGSRVISAQKANTANAFSLDGYAISTANLYSAVQPGGSLYGLQASNPVDASRVYGGSPNSYGTKSDYLRNKRVGGVNVFGGGLALYKGGKKVGALGVSGDTSCRDHAYAWVIRSTLGMQAGGTGITTANVNVAGVVQTPLAGATVGDEMIVNMGAGDAYWDAWSQPACPNTVTGTSIGTIAN
jgi:uncharacterized protein GlcG (DUF336 family)